MVELIGIRNKAINVYDDYILVVSPTVCKAFNANTDPTASGRNRAKIDKGTYTFYKGQHKGLYDALRAYPEGVKLPCTRDGTPSTCQYINIHRGGVYTTSSEGCQTLKPDQWDEFIKLVYSEMTKNNQSTITYRLV